MNAVTVDTCALSEITCFHQTWSHPLAAICQVIDTQTSSLISLCLFPYLSNQDPTGLAGGVAVRFQWVHRRQHLAHNSPLIPVSVSRRRKPSLKNVSWHPGCSLGGICFYFNAEDVCMKTGSSLLRNWSTPAAAFSPLKCHWQASDEWQ